MLKGVGIGDITEVCMANGITAKSDIKRVIEDCDNDLRRVKRRCHAISKTNLEK